MAIETKTGRMTNSDLYMTPPNRDQETAIEPAPKKTAPFTTDDVIYIRILLESSEGSMELRSIRRFLNPQVRTAIEDALQALSKIPSPKDVNLRAYFDGEIKGGPMTTIYNKITYFASLDTEGRLAFMKKPAQAALVLKPLSYLPEEDLTFWHRMSHLDFSRRMAHS